MSFSALRFFHEVASPQRYVLPSPSVKDSRPTASCAFLLFSKIIEQHTLWVVSRFIVPECMSSPGVRPSLTVLWPEMRVALLSKY
jgi:hypothetical protein